MTKPLVIHSDPEILGGTPVFVGTRVPVQTLLDYLLSSFERGRTITSFHKHFTIFVISASSEPPTAILRPKRRT